MSIFTRPLIVSPQTDGKTWTLVEPFCYDVGFEGSKNTIDVPAGFITDFASVPRPFWWIIPRWGSYGNAAVVHDYLYQTGTKSRKYADEIFLEAMKVSGTSWICRHIMFLAVRIFGGLAYHG
jgi:hypothetical protein